MNFKKVHVHLPTLFFFSILCLLVISNILLRLEKVGRDFEFFFLMKRCTCLVHFSKISVIDYGSSLLLHPRLINKRFSWFRLDNQETRLLGKSKFLKEVFKSSKIA